MISLHQHQRKACLSGDSMALWSSYSSHVDKLGTQDYCQIGARAISDSLPDDGGVRPGKNGQLTQFRRCRRLH